MLKKVLLRAPILSRSGYGEHARFVFRALQTKKTAYDVHIEALNWGTTSWNIDPPQDIIDGIIKRQSFQGTYDICLMVGVPHEWSPGGKINIGLTAAVETDRCTPDWANVCSQIDKVIAVSEHAKRSICGPSSVYVTTNDLGEQQHICCHPSKIDVVGFPVKEFKLNESNSLNLDLKTDFNFLAVSQMSARKNALVLVEWFMKEFSDNEDVGLVLKYNGPSTCMLDRFTLREHLQILLSRYRNSKASVYLLHGNLTEEEMESLYHHDKIKAYASTTCGEGFGLPIFQAAANGMPVVATNWSAHLEFLRAPVTNPTSKKTKVKSLFTKVQYDLKDVPQDALMPHIITEGMKWAYVREDSFRKGIRNVYQSYAARKKEAKLLQEYVREEFSEQQQIDKLLHSIESVSGPVENVSDQDLDNYLEDILSE